MTVSEVASALRVTTQTVYRWVAEGKIQATRFGVQHRVPRAEFDRIKAEGIKRGGNPESEWESRG